MTTVYQIQGYAKTLDGDVVNTMHWNMSEGRWRDDRDDGEWTTTTDERLAREQLERAQADCGDLTVSLVEWADDYDDPEAA